jgi:hypothetical protein
VYYTYILKVVKDLTFYVQTSVYIRYVFLMAGDAVRSVRNLPRFLCNIMLANCMVSPRGPSRLLATAHARSPKPCL